MTNVIAKLSLAAQTLCLLRDDIDLSNNDLTMDGIVYSENEFLVRIKNYVVVNT